MYTIIATNSVLITKIEIIICNILDCSYIYLILIITIGKKIVNEQYKTLKDYVVYDRRDEVWLIISFCLRYNSATYFL